MSKEIKNTTTTKFTTAAEAYKALFGDEHQKIMAERKALKAAIDKAIADYRTAVKDLEAKDKANFEAWKKAQAELREQRKVEPIEIVDEKKVAPKANKKPATNKKAVEKTEKVEA